MIPKRRLLVNAAAGLIQVLVVGVTFLVVYRFVKDELGISQFGVWALVLATVSVNSIANLGIASATVKFVPMYLARGMTDRVVEVIETSVVSLGLFLAVVLPLAYPLILIVVEQAIEPELFPLARSVLPYAIVSFWVNAVSLVLQGCLDGYQRIELRSMLVSGAAILYMVLVFWLVRLNGLVGLAQAQVIQATVLLIGTWLTLRRIEGSLPYLPFRWSRSMFRKTLKYSLTFQAISITQLLFEPTTKILLAMFAGSATLGYFEFAHRMVFQIRSLIVSAYQAVVPTIADLQERDPDLIRRIYVESLQFLLYIVGPSLGFFVLLSPLVSSLWIGTVVPEFILFSGLLFAGWFLNVLSSPAYFANAGTGQLRWNLIGHLVTGVCNIVLGVTFGALLGGEGVVAAFSFALVAGSATTAVAYHRKNATPAKTFLDRDTTWLLAASLLAYAVGGWLYHYAGAGGDWTLIQWLSPTLFLAAIAYPMWMHRQRHKAYATVSSFFSETR